MRQYGTLLGALIILAIFTNAVHCRPVEDDQGDFHIDDVPLGPEGSGGEEKETSKASLKGVPLLTSEDDIPGDVSGSGLPSDGDELEETVSGSASGDADGGANTGSVESPEPAKFTSMETVNVSSSTARTPTSARPTTPELFTGGFDQGSGREEDPDVDLTTEAGADLISGSGSVFTTEAVTTSSLSTRRHVQKSTEMPTLPPDVGISEDLIPVSAVRTTGRADVSSTAVVTSVPTTTPESLPLEVTIPTPNVTLTVDGDRRETTRMGSTAAADTTAMSEATRTTTQDKTDSSTQATNHSRRIEGRRRRPSHAVTTEMVAYDEASVGAAKKEEDDGKKVSYFAVIAAGLICAIVFFALGFLASKLRDNRGTFTLPWKKDRVSLGVNSGAGNGSAVQVYRDTNPDRHTSVYDELHPDSAKAKPKVNGSSERVPTSDMAEIHPKPAGAVESEPHHAAANAPPTGSESPEVPTTSAPSLHDSLEEMKYMDETDDDMDQPAASAPLLPGEATEDGDREDLASEVLNTVEKNLNSASESTALLPEGDTSGRRGSKPGASAGDLSPV